MLESIAGKYTFALCQLIFKIASYWYKFGFEGSEVGRHFLLKLGPLFYYVYSKVNEISLVRSHPEPAASTALPALL